MLRAIAVCREPCRQHGAPPAMIPFLQKHQAGEPYDTSAFEACLAGR